MATTEVLIKKTDREFLITCDHCGAQFILHGVSGAPNDYEEMWEDVYTLWEQTDANEKKLFCPYCGKQTRKDK